MEKLESTNTEETKHPQETTPRRISANVSRKVCLLGLIMATMAVCDKTTFAEEIDKKSSATKEAVKTTLDDKNPKTTPPKLPVEPEKMLAQAGKLHGIYLEIIKAIQVPTEDDRKFLRESKLSQIRYNPRIFHPKQDEETIEQQTANLKKETARRLRAYTTQDEDWFTLDFKKMGADKRVNVTHEYNVQLGDILVDTDIRTILIQRKDGTIIKAKRGVSEIGGYKDRVGFLDNKGQFVPVFTGDKFRILSSKENRQDYQTWIEYEDDRRAITKEKYHTQRGSTVFTGEAEALKAAKRISYNPDKITEPTKQMIEAANKECGSVTKNYYTILGERTNTVEIMKYAANELGVPVELGMVTAKKEGGFDLHAKGDPETTGMGDPTKPIKTVFTAIGMAQLHEERFDAQRRKPEVKRILEKVTGKDASKAKRGKTVLIDVVTMTATLRGSINANADKIDLKTLTSKTHLTREQLAWIIYDYHTPGNNRNKSEKHRNKLFNKRKAGYYRRADEMLRVRGILDQLEKETKETEGTKPQS